MLPNEPKCRKTIPQVPHATSLSSRRSAAGATRFAAIAARWYRHIAPVVAKMHEVDRFSARLCTLPGVYENLIPGASSASGKAEAKGPDPRPRRRGQQRPTLVGVEVGRELGDAAGGVGAAAAKDPQRVQDFRVQIGAPDPCGVSKSILPGGFGGRRLQVYLLLQLPSRARNIRWLRARGPAISCSSYGSHSSAAVRRALDDAFLSR